MVAETIGEPMTGTVYSSTTEQRKSLAGVIETIESMPAYLLPDRKKAKHTAFENWVGQEPLVADVRDGKKTFGGEYERVFGRYPALRSLFPCHLPEKMRATRDALERVTGEVAMFGDDTLLGKILGYVMNPVGMAAAIGFGFSMTVVIDTGLSAVRDMEIAGAFGVFVGAVVGAVPGFIRAESLSHMRNNAAYLDDRIQEAYR